MLTAKYEVVIDISAQTEMDGEYTLGVFDKLEYAKDSAERLALFTIQVLFEGLADATDLEDNPVEIYIRRTSDNKIIHREALPL